MSIDHVAAGESLVQRLRIIVGASVVVALALTILVPRAPRLAGVEFLVVPAALAGAVAPVVGFRLMQWRRQRARQLADDSARRQAYGHACLCAVGVTEAAALFGLGVAAFTDEPLALLGVVTHVLLVGAVWPSIERMEIFVDGEGDA